MRKETTVILRLTNKEKQELRMNAHKNCKSMSEYIRSRVIGK